MILSDGEIMALLKARMLVKRGNPPTSEFLEWLYERLEKIHYEDTRVDFMHTFKGIIDSLKEIESLLT